MERGDTEELRDGDGDGDVYGEAITHPADAWPATGQEHEYRFNVGFGGGGVWWYRKGPGRGGPWNGELGGWKSLADVLSVASALSAMRPGKPAGPEEHVDPKTPTWETRTVRHNSPGETSLQRTGWEPFSAWPDVYGGVRVMYRRVRPPP